MAFWSTVDAIQSAASAAGVPPPVTKPVAFGALAGGAIDVYVDYAGTLWTAEMKRTDAPPAATMLPAIARWARADHGVAMVGALGFENAYAFAMRAADARRLGIGDLSALAAASPRLRLGSDLEFLDRPEWAAVQRAYPMRFAATTPYSPTFMYRALESGGADVITAFSSDGRIAADRLVTLADPRGAIPRYDALLLVGRARAADPRFLAALRPLVGAIGIGAMRAANYRVDRSTDKQTPEASAALLDHAIGRAIGRGGHDVAAMSQ